MYAGQEFDFECDGRPFRAFVEEDETNASTLPWKNADGHGVVTEWERRDKRPGEWILCTDRHDKRFYDHAETMRIAKRDGWGLTPEHVAELGRKLGRTPTDGDIAAEAVRRDYEYLRGWCNDEWSYVGVCVCALDDEGEPIGDKYDHALWGVDSCSDDYIREIARELASKILAEEQAAAYPVNTTGI